MWLLRTGCDEGVHVGRPASSALVSLARCRLSQIEGCGVSVAGMRGYFVRHRLCSPHSSLSAVLLNGAPHRLCQQ